MRSVLRFVALTFPALLLTIAASVGDANAQLVRPRGVCQQTTYGWSCDLGDGFVNVQFEGERTVSDFLTGDRETVTCQFGVCCVFLELAVPPTTSNWAAACSSQESKPDHSRKVAMR